MGMCLNLKIRNLKKKREFRCGMIIDDQEGRQGIIGLTDISASAIWRSDDRDERVMFDAHPQLNAVIFNVPPRSSTEAERLRIQSIKSALHETGNVLLPTKPASLEDALDLEEKTPSRGISCYFPLRYSYASDMMNKIIQEKGAVSVASVHGSWHVAQFSGLEDWIFETGSYAIDYLLYLATGGGITPLDLEGLYIFSGVDASLNTINLVCTLRTPPGVRYHASLMLSEHGDRRMPMMGRFEVILDCGILRIDGLNSIEFTEKGSPEAVIYRPTEDEFITVSGETGLMDGWRRFVETEVGDGRLPTLRKINTTLVICKCILKAVSEKSRAVYYDFRGAFDNRSKSEILGIKIF